MSSGVDPRPGNDETDLLRLLVGESLIAFSQWLTASWLSTESQFRGLIEHERQAVASPSTAIAPASRAHGRSGSTASARGEARPVGIGRR